MMYVIYNEDGSIKYKHLNEFVEQGNSYENFLFLAFTERQPEEFALYCNFKLPNGDTNTIVSSDSTISKTIEGETYRGKTISLSNAQTFINGVLQMNVVVKEYNTEKKLVGFNIFITINETGIQQDDPVIITRDEYERIIEPITNKHSVRYDVQQSLTDSQKQQARDNIGIDDLLDLVLPTIQRRGY